MSEPPDRPDDESIASIEQLYRSDRPEPPESVDAAIRTAAVADLARPPQRQRRYPVGLGAAAAAVLAVLMFLPQTAIRDAIDPTRHFDASEFAHLETPPPASAPAIQAPAMTAPEMAATHPPRSDKPDAGDLRRNREEANQALNVAGGRDNETPKVPAGSISADRDSNRQRVAADASRPPAAAQDAQPPVETAEERVASTETHALAPISAIAATAPTEPPWCASPARYDGPFATLPGTVSILVCDGDALRLRASGGTCAETFTRTGAVLEIDPERGSILIRDARGSAELGCVDGVWVLTPGS